MSSIKVNFSNNFIPQEQVIYNSVVLNDRNSKGKVD